MGHTEASGRWNPAHRSDLVRRVLGHRAATIDGAEDEEQAGAVTEAERVLRDARGVLTGPCEAERLSSLHSYDIMDTPAEPAYDDLVRLAAAVLDAPAAYLNLVDADRQWGKAVAGADSVSLARELSICSDVVALDAPVVVEDVAEHPRYRLLADVLIPLGVRSYVGVPVAGRDGLPLGALCVTDSVPRRATAPDIAMLTVLARQAGAQLDLRRNEGRTGLAPRGSAHGRLIADAHDPRRLRRALHDDEFEPYFQPVVDLGDERVVGHEALVRWAHPALGILTPDRFLPAFETSEMILSLDGRVLDRSLAALSRLRRQPGAADRHVAVNISGRELNRPGLADRVAAALQRHAMGPDALVVEVTETTETDPDVRRRELLRLLDLGVGVLIDDYGSGYANTYALLDTPASGVKIDRSIISRISADERARLLLAGVTRAAIGLGLYVIAEGVEDRETARVAADCGVRLAQGYAFGHPTPELDTH
jgi:EAL domain-containing protein (putative c-di-GMP-specific phosphodiesterase class I)/GAF domain-containing protein